MQLNKETMKETHRQNLDVLTRHASYILAEVIFFWFGLVWFYDIAGFFYDCRLFNAISCL